MISKPFGAKDHFVALQFLSSHPRSGGRSTRRFSPGRGLLVLLLASPAWSGVGDGEIAVLLRDRAGRDADLSPRPLSAEELEELGRVAGVTLRPVRMEPDGSEVLQIPGLGDGPRSRAVLAMVRALPDVVWADRVVEAKAVSSPAGGTLDRLVVKMQDRALRDGSDRGEPLPREVVDQLSRIAGVPLYHERTVSGGAHALRLFQKMPDATVIDLARRLAQDPSVTWAEATVRGRFGGRPNDPLYDRQWSLARSPAGIDVERAWRHGRGLPGIAVAVLDSGIRPEHPDLRGRLAPGFDFVSDARRSGDFDGRDPDPTDPGDAALAGECAVGAAATDSTWHGTHVAGLIGAATDNGTGIAGVAPRVRLVPVRVGGRCGIDPIDLVDAIRWASGAVAEGVQIADVPAASPRARVLNLSMEFPGPCPRMLQDAISDAIAAGALVVVAAGNAGAQAASYHPANCRGVLAVNATDSAGARAPYSNRGDVDISAPGGSMTMAASGGMISTVVGGEREAGVPEYDFKEGTSMAAPLVSGVASLVFSASPRSGPAEVHNILEATARPFPVGTGADCDDAGPDSCGAGILDAGAAVATAASIGRTSR